MIDSLDNYVHQDQLYLIFRNLLHLFVCKFLYYYFSVLYLLSVATMYPISILTNIFQETWNFVWAVIQDAEKLLALFKLVFVMFIVFLKSTFCYVCGVDHTDYEKKALETYPKMKSILDDFGVLPLSEQDSIIAYLLLKLNFLNFIWSYILPFPSFLFDDTFSKSDDGQSIFARLPPPQGATVFMVKTEDNDEEFIQTDYPQRGKSDSRTDKKTTPKSNGNSPLHSDGKSTYGAEKTTKQSNEDISTAREQDKDQPSKETFDPLKNLMSMFH